MLTDSGTRACLHLVCDVAADNVLLFVLLCFSQGGVQPRRLCRHFTQQQIEHISAAAVALGRWV